SAQVVRTPALPLASWLSLVPYRLGLKRVFAYLNWPDGGIGWMPFALATALRTARRDRPDVIYSTSTPQSGHIAALIVSRLTGVVPHSHRFVLAHVGTIYGIRDPSPVLRALARLIQRGMIDGERVAVRLIGSLWLERFEPPSGVRVERTGYVGHKRAVEEMCK